MRATTMSPPPRVPAPRLGARDPARTLPPARHPVDDTPRRPVGRAALACGRIGLVALWTLVACGVQPVLLLLPGRGKVHFARLYWAGVCRLLGLTVRVLGAPPERAPGLAARPGPGDAAGARPVVFAANHCSWLDIAALGSRLEACFVAKTEVAGWPMIGLVARLGRTVFVSRRRHGTGRERDDMQLRLASGDNLLLFPEGTSSDGSRVLPFHSSFFSVMEAPSRPLLRPVSLAYDRLGGLPAGRSTRPLFAWYGDMELAPHIWRLAQCRGMRITVMLHAPLDPAAFPTRKALAQAAWEVVAEGAAAVRQSRAA